eukprot:CAMPEP_0172455972 /NCGR_PEP_ID=MMETSP1065-20121228/13450_1 /TAXON_ID=265537 /ORGANISM="Amphiprora paludosa, Strain CCMP125" /LENGTH=384 /DNA_ID=CAMNT_0013208543 /DNA_START=52 /DNA_END=1203 /DNA_ORIENTATION=+
MTDVDVDAEKRAWREAAVANGVVLESVDLQDREDMKELYGMLRVAGVAAKSRLRAFIHERQQLQQQGTGTTTERKQIQEMYEMMMVQEKTEKKSFTAANTSFVGELLDGYDMKFRLVDSEDEPGKGDPVGRFSWALSIAGGGGEATLSEPDRTEAALNWIQSWMTIGLTVDGLSVKKETIGFKDVKGQLLHPLHANHREASGKSDGCVASEKNIQLCDRTGESLYNYSMALIEVQTDHSQLKKTQMLLQLAALSLQSIYKQSVVLLGTDCHTKWYLLHFEEPNRIQVQQYVHGRKCLDDFEALLVSTKFRYDERQAVNTKRQKSVHAGEQDLTGFQDELSSTTGLVPPAASPGQRTTDKALNNEAFLHRMANFLAESPMGNGEW